MGYQSEIVVTYSNQSPSINIEQFVNKLLVNGWRLGIKSEIHAKDRKSKYISLPYSLYGINAFRKILINQTKCRKYVNFDISNFASDRHISITYDFDREKILTFSLLNEDPKNRLINPTAEIKKYLNQLFIAIVSCGQIDKIQFVSGYDYEEIYTLENESLLEYAYSLKI